MLKGALYDDTQSGTSFYIAPQFAFFPLRWLASAQEFIQNGRIIHIIQQPYWV